MRCYMTIEFDRPVIAGNHYISPGSYEVIADGKNYRFDFNESSGYIDQNNPKLVHFELRDEDDITFPEINILRKKLHKITEFVECYVYVGETEEDPEINPVAVKTFCITVHRPGTRKPNNTKFIRCEKNMDEIAYIFTKELLKTCVNFPQ